MTFDEMKATYILSLAESIGLLARLDKLSFIELLPNNRFKLKVARTFSWVPNRLIMQAFKNNVADFSIANLQSHVRCCSRSMRDCHNRPTWRWLIAQSGFRVHFLISTMRTHT